jgi:hypothetical protein
MHILRRPSFFFANKIGAPYGPLDGSIRLVSSNSRI